MPGTAFMSRYFLLSRHQYVPPLYSPLLADILVEQHEKETSLQGGYSLQGVLLLASILVIAWQNRAYISNYVLQGVVSYVQSFKGSIVQ